MQCFVSWQVFRNTFSAVIYYRKFLRLLLVFVRLVYVPRSRDDAWDALRDLLDNSNKAEYS